MARLHSLRGIDRVGHVLAAIPTLHHQGQTYEDSDSLGCDTYLSINQFVVITENLISLYS